MKLGSPVSQIAVTWCRCGPYVDAIRHLLACSEGASLEWQALNKWIAPQLGLSEGGQVLLGEVDLCHRPGLVRIHRPGIISAAHFSRNWTRLSITALPANAHGWTAMEPGRLIAEAGLMDQRCHAGGPCFGEAQLKGGRHFGRRYLLSPGVFEGPAGPV